MSIRNSELIQQVVEQMIYHDSWTDYAVASAIVAEVFDWKPIDTAPRDGTEILGAMWINRTSGWRLDICGYSAADEGWFSEYHKISPTLWLPIPELPDMTEEGPSK